MSRENNTTLLDSSDLNKVDETPFQQTVPSHVAFIMDGNRRWSHAKGLSLTEGYTQGADKLNEIVSIAIKEGINTLTFYAFSTENWHRSEYEVSIVMDLFVIYMKKMRRTFIRQGIRLETLGDLSRLPSKVYDVLMSMKEETRLGKSIQLNLALNYGGRDEIRRAFCEIYEDLREEKIFKSDVTEDLISRYLDTKNIKDPDLLIRTSGEFRLSNFLLWQLSYTEMYFTDCLWPNFTGEEFKKALSEYKRRQRRDGA